MRVSVEWCSVTGWGECEGAAVAQGTGEAAVTGAQWGLNINKIILSR